MMDAVSFLSVRPLAPLLKLVESKVRSTEGRAVPRMILE